MDSANNSDNDKINKFGPTSRCTESDMGKSFCLEYRMQNEYIGGKN